MRPLSRCSPVLVSNTESLSQYVLSSLVAKLNNFLVRLLLGYFIREAEKRATEFREIFIIFAFISNIGNLVGGFRFTALIEHQKTLDDPPGLLSQIS
jgi:hypothetical protein